jgi:hypothetical protein
MLHFSKKSSLVVDIYTNHRCILKKNNDYNLGILGIKNEIQDIYRDQKII